MQRTPTLRLLLSFAALCALAAAVVAGGGADLPLFVALNDAAARWLPAALPSNLTVLGHGLVAVMLLALTLPRAPRVLAAGLCAAPLGGIFSTVGKRLAARPRPGALLDSASFHVQGPLLSGHNSFPSGHSITLFLTATVLILGIDALRERPWRALAVLALALFAAASRVMVGAHWPSDVLGGAALGTVAGAAGSWCAQRWPWWRKPRAAALLALATLACAAALVGTDTGYPRALALQWAAAALGAAAAVRTLLRCCAPPRTPAP